MSVSYRNAPLVELVTELRWAPATQNNGTQTGIVLSFPETKGEEWFMHMGALMSSQGYGRFERVVPPGFPSVHGQVVCRFRPTEPDKQSPLYQMGPGVFTSNALPPYESWHKFSPFVRTGVEALLMAFDRAQIARPPFNAALVRYIDAFRDNLTGGRSVLEFMKEVLKFDFAVPPAISRIVTDVKAIQPTIQLVVPTAIGRLEMTLGEAKMGNDRAVLMDMSILIQRDLGSDVDLVIDTFTEGRLVIHELFRGLTESIHANMEPVT
jgi:uncharacterized protein (TIGR04255 family)